MNRPPFRSSVFLVTISSALEGVDIDAALKGARLRWRWRCKRRLTRIRGGRTDRFACRASLMAARPEDGVECDLG